MHISLNHTGIHIAGTHLELHLVYD